jgi:hypothetical protein
MAVSPLTESQQQQAQAYGKTNAKLALTEFLQPWCSFEESVMTLKDTEECAYLYTRYLLIANKAREDSLAGKEIKLSDCQEVIEAYDGTLTFSVRVYGNYDSFIRSAAGELIQSGKGKVRPYQSTVPEKAVSFVGKGKDAFGAQCYFYFDETELDLTKPAILEVVTGDGNIHRFYFDLIKIK